jgi:hypothetical protein
MSKTRPEAETGFRSEPTRVLPPVDKHVKIPEQVHLAAARAEDLIAGRSSRIETPGGKVRSKTRSKRGIPYSDTQMDEVLERWDRGTLNVNDPDFSIIIELAREGARLTKAHRSGAQKDRKKSTEVTRRMKALIQAYRELNPRLQKHPTGQPTIERLRKAIIRKLGLPNDDKELSEDTIRQDIRQVRPHLRLIEKGHIPATGKPIRQGLSEKTLREMKAGQAAVALAASANKGRRPSKYKAPFKG